MQMKNFRAYPTRAQPRGGDGIDYVRCLTCGKHLCVISGRHLSTHGTDRKTYIEQYALSPDQLCSKTFRVNHSSRRDYSPHNKRDWIAVIKKIHKQHGQVFAGYLKGNLPHLYSQGVWLFGDWDKALSAAGFAPEQMRLWAYWDQQKLIRQIQTLRKRIYHSMPSTSWTITRSCSLLHYVNSGRGKRLYSLPA